MKTTLTTLLAAACLLSPARASDTGDSINNFGLALHQRLAAGGGNIVASPWSIQTALAMTYAGADGETKAEMAKVLHFGPDEKAVHKGLAALAADLQKLAAGSAERVKAAKGAGEKASPMTITTANRIFGDEGKVFEKPFLATLEGTYRSPLETLSFKKDAEAARMKINGWAQEKTKERIKDLIPKGGIDPTTRLVLCNAVHLKAPWAEPFTELSDFSFRVNGKNKTTVPGLRCWSNFGYLKVPGGAAVTVPYADSGLHFVILVPDEVDGLADMEKQLTAKTLAAVAKAKPQDVLLKMPAFKLTPQTGNLASHLEKMGMRTAFDKPEGSADFSRMATRTPSDYLFVNSVFHKAFIAVDKNGTEAAAATAVVMALGGGVPPNQPIEVWADRPFAFAIQHAASGACLFLGRVTDPR